MMIHERKDYNKRVVCTDGSIPKDEPVFLLRGKDPTAVECVAFWLKLNLKELSAEKVASIGDHAVKMARYADQVDEEDDGEDREDGHWLNEM